MTSFINASLIMWAITFIDAPPPANSSPTMCEFITVEYQAALDRGQITEREYWQLVKNCDKVKFNR
jgi:hypothetical protein